MKDKIKNFKKTNLIIILTLILLILAILASALFSAGEKPQERPKPAPSVSIGCDQVLWKDTELENTAATQNIDKPLFEWVVDGKIAGNTQRQSQKFNIGEHLVILNVSFDNGTLTAKKSIVVIGSVDGISLRDSAASKNQWGFQTIYKGKSTGVKGVMISVDSSPLHEVNPCGFLLTGALSAGEHTWRSEYQGTTIASGTFNLKEASEIKIIGIEIAPSYTAGDTVNGKIVLKNMGSTTVTGFDIKTLVVNNNYVWMGDVAKREYFNQYSSDIKPGGIYEIPIRITIPEKVNGIRPSGRYTITVELMLKGQVMDTKVVNTDVK